jgi:threonine/homoserine/homoserine lactone efflux protein
MQPTLVIVASILGALAVGVVSPGPSFVLVARTAIALSRRDGVASALGMGVGGVIFATLALIGLQAVLAKAAWLYVGLRLLGGIYLITIAVALWRGAAQPLAMSDAPQRPGGIARSFWSGLATQVSNPKTTVVYGSVFAALLPADVPVTLFLVLPPLIFLIETGWYVIVALAFSADRPRAAYLGWKFWIDRIAGAVMGALGVRLIADALRPA